MRRLNPAVSCLPSESSIISLTLKSNCWLKQGQKGLKRYFYILYLYVNAYTSTYIFNKNLFSDSDMWPLQLIFFHPVPQSERLLRESRLEEDPRQQPGRLQTQVVRNQVSRQLRQLQGRSALFPIRVLSPFPVGGRLPRVLTPLRPSAPPPSVPGEQLLFQIPNNGVLTTKIGLLCSLRDYERVSLKVDQGQRLR